MNPSLLSSPMSRETLYLYLAISDAAVSTTLVRDDNDVQRLIYYMSKALQGAESRYPNVDKLALAIIVLARKLRPYFQAHPIFCCGCG